MDSVGDGVPVIHSFLGYRFLDKTSHICTEPNVPVQKLRSPITVMNQAFKVFHSSS